MSPVPTVIFDFDGTLVDSLSASMETGNALAPVFGYRAITREEIPELKTMTLPELFRHLEIPLSRVPAVLARARKEMQRQIPRIQLFPGMREVIGHLRDSGAKLGIVTSNSIRNVRDCLGHNGVQEQFEFVHSASSLFGKHRILRRLMRRMRIPVDGVVYVGDEARDIEASRRCRIPVISVAWGFQDRQRLLQMCPDFLADVPVEIEVFVRRLFPGLAFDGKNSTRERD